MAASYYVKLQITFATMVQSETITANIKHLWDKSVLSLIFSQKAFSDKIGDKTLSRLIFCLLIKILSPNLSLT